MSIPRTIWTLSPAHTVSRSFLFLFTSVELSGGNVRIGKMQLLASGKVRLVTVDGDVYEVR